MKLAMRRVLGMLILAAILPACGGAGGGTLSPTTAPGIPADLKVLSGNGRLTLQWTSPSASGTFTVLRGITSGGPYFPVSVPGGFVTPTTYRDSGLTNGTSYYYRVIAQNGFGVSAPSDEAAGMPEFRPLFIDGGTGYHCLAVFEDGTAWGWGWNSSGELGTGKIGNVAYEAVEVKDLSGVTVVSAGGGFSLAIRSDGTVWSWGVNTQGQLGLGGSAPSPVLSPTAISSLTNITAVAAGNGHSLALRVDGTVWAWGTNDRGELGLGVIGAPVAVPAQVVGLSDVAAIAAGSSASMALKRDGTVWTWGDNNNGQLGDGSTVFESAFPVQVDNLNGVAAITIGGAHNLAVREDGTVWAWGQNGAGQLGNGTSSPTPTRKPVKVSTLTDATAVAAGVAHSLAVRRDGLLFSWGNNSGQGVLGNGSLSGTSNVPVQVVGLTDVRSITAGYVHSHVQRRDGTVWSWGQNLALGIGNGPSSDIPVQAGNFTGATAVAAAARFTLALRADQSVWGWGTNEFGQQANGTQAAVANSTPTLLASPVGVAKIACGGGQCLALRTDGKVWAWGANSLGQCGNGNASILYVTTPAAVVGLTGTYVAIGGGAIHSLAVRSDGVVWAWGDNNTGQLGNGTTTPPFTAVATPVQVLNVTGATAAAAGGGFSLALKNDSTVWAWGTNTAGQLGTGAVSATPVSSPVQIPGLTGVTAIACGGRHALALRNDGTVWAWGDNSDGQIGDGDPSTTPRPAPVQVPNLTGVVALAAGQFHSLALRGDGTVWAWGYNQAGQLGGDNNTSSFIPLQVLNLMGATVISAGQSYSVARTSDGSIWGWGDNSSGVLGIPYIQATAVPVVITR